MHTTRLHIADEDPIPMISKRIELTTQLLTQLVWTKATVIVAIYNNTVVWLHEQR